MGGGLLVACCSRLACGLWLFEAYQHPFWTEEPRPDETQAIGVLPICPIVGRRLDQRFEQEFRKVLCHLMMYLWIVLLAGRGKRPGELLHQNQQLLPHFSKIFTLNFPLSATSLTVSIILWTPTASCLLPHSHSHSHSCLLTTTCIGIFDDLPTRPSCLTNDTTTRMITRSNIPCVFMVCWTRG